MHGLTIKAGTCFLNTPKREMFLDQRFVVLVARTVKMCGDAVFLFCLYSLEHCKVPRDQYILEAVINNFSD